VSRAFRAGKKVLPLSHSLCTSTSVINCARPYRAQQQLLRYLDFFSQPGVKDSFDLDYCLEMFGESG
jgi:hypothetical protein